MRLGLRESDARWWVVAVGANLVDGFGSLLLIHQGWALEGNPVVAFALGFSWWSMLLVKAGSIGAGYLLARWARVTRLAWWGLRGTTAVMVAVSLIVLGGALCGFAIGLGPGWVHGATIANG